MPGVNPLSRRNLIRKLTKAGFKGPIPGGKHDCMIKDNIRITIPNPHRGDIGVKLVKKIMKHANLREDEWDKL